MTTTTEPMTETSNVDTLAGFESLDADRIADEITHRINQIEAERREAEQAEAEHAEELARAEEAIERARAKIKQNQDRVSATQLRRRQLELELARAEAQRLPEPVTLEVARQCGVDLLRAFGTLRGQTYSDPTDKRTEGRADDPPLIDQRVRVFWEECDRIRNRLLTPEVSDDATLVTLAVEGVIHSCERWTDDHGTSVDTPGFSLVGLGAAPPLCIHCQTAEDELRSVLAGNDPPESYSIGMLFGDGVPLVQIVGMVGLKRPNRNPDMGAFGRLVDTTDKHQNSFRFVRWLGCFSIETAWRYRQSRLQYRRDNNKPHCDLEDHGQ